MDDPKANIPSLEGRCWTRVGNLDVYLGATAGLCDVGRWRPASIHKRTDRRPTAGKLRSTPRFNKVGNIGSGRASMKQQGQVLVPIK